MLSFLNIHNPAVMISFDLSFIRLHRSINIILFPRLSLSVWSLVKRCSKELSFAYIGQDVIMTSIIAVVFARQEAVLDEMRDNMAGQFSVQKL